MNSNESKVTTTSLLIALGIVYGDIGTSPLYVLKAIIGKALITSELIYGGLSLIFWTLTLQATFKYIFITLQADNKGEGGVFALYALIRRRAPGWVIYPAMIGCAALLADGMLTPAISLTSSIEGLEEIYHSVPVVPIVLAILAGLFFFQQFGTEAVGKSFGSVMMVWFSVLMVLGAAEIAGHPEILAALSPVYAVRLLISYPDSWYVVGAVFLCVTGAEALYSDLGHVGRRNIRISWIFVKTALVINYFGQGVWALNHAGSRLGESNPFFAIMPEWFVPFGVGLATLASIIASQALITGSFSLINEAIKLKTWFRVRITYPSRTKHQMYVPFINLLLFAGSTFVVLYFQESENMEAAYGIAITIAMLSTTLLLSYFLGMRKQWPLALRLGILGPILIVELGFFSANLLKVAHGAGVSLAIGGAMFVIMYIFHEAEDIIRHKRYFVSLKQYLPLLRAVSEDREIPRFATNLVYLTYAIQPDRIEKNLIKSLFLKQPKRADHYWLLHINETDEPYTSYHQFTELEPGKVYRLDYYFGFKVHPDIKKIFQETLRELANKNLISLESGYESLRAADIPADFLFVLTRTTFNATPGQSFLDQIIVRSYRLLNRLSEPAETHFGLDKNTLLVEYVALQ